MISNREVKPLLDREPRFEDIMCSLNSVPRLPRAIIKETKEVIAIARKFNDEVVRPYALDLDRKKHEDPDYLPWGFVKKANEWGFYTMWIPKIFGGKGLNMPSMSYFLEEIASACTGMANLIGVHYLGVVTISASWHIRLMNKLFRDTLEGEKRGSPCLISLAITEPGAGTDVEEVALVKKAKVTCHAKKVNGGYIVNGRKIFISNGHLSTWHMLIAYSDLKRPAESTVMLAVRNGTKGFSFGTQEIKMGQKGCPASELIFEDCFIPDENVCFDPIQIKKFSRSVKETNMQVIDYVVSGSRAGVGAFGTGVARGAFEEALRFASETEVDGRLLINHEWAQCMLAEMYKNVAIARLSYVETNYANGLYGIFKLLQWKPIFYYTKYMPKSIIDRFISPFLDLPITTWLFRKINFDWQKDEEAQRTSGWASLSKFVGTDMGVKNCQLALELMGQAGLRHDMRAEKHLRDSKLLQIYEGTNQLNRLNLFKCLIGRSIPQARVFEE
ncbi:MAG: acyl-CoA/acyl-ACP dehydrogenase [Deltaproteobacteria bacterium]|nr:acyl-CoA/acyl-ACP dehydrogenase [Deltaproteobacteria bacterium]